VFPDPSYYTFPEWVLIGEWAYYGRDVVSFGDPLTVENLRDAYANGIFPWHMDGIPLPWYCPEQRAVLEFQDLRIPASLRRARRRSDLLFTVDQDFPGVMKGCQNAFRPGQNGTWITQDFIDAYARLHDEGMAHSAEAWSPEGELVGGIYGVDAGGVFCGESMFYNVPNASKLALLHLIDHVRSRGSTWMDVQVMTPHIRALGAKEIKRPVFLAKLKKTRSEGLVLFP